MSTEAALGTKARTAFFTALNTANLGGVDAGEIDDDRSDVGAEVPIKDNNGVSITESMSDVLSDATVIDSDIFSDDSVNLGALHALSSLYSETSAAGIALHLSFMLPPFTFPTMLPCMSCVYHLVMHHAEGSEPAAAAEDAGPAAGPATGPAAAPPAQSRGRGRGRGRGRANHRASAVATPAAAAEGAGPAGAHAPEAESGGPAAGPAATAEAAGPSAAGPSYGPAPKDAGAAQSNYEHFPGGFSYSVGHVMRCHAADGIMDDELGGRFPPVGVGDPSRAAVLKNLINTVQTHSGAHNTRIAVDASGSIYTTDGPGAPGSGVKTAEAESGGPAAEKESAVEEEAADAPSPAPAAAAEGAGPAGAHAPEAEGRGPAAGPATGPAATAEAAGPSAAGPSYGPAPKDAGAAPWYAPGAARGRGRGRGNRKGRGIVRNKFAPIRKTKAVVNAIEGIEAPGASASEDIEASKKRKKSGPRVPSTYKARLAAAQQYLDAPNPKYGRGGIPSWPVCRFKWHTHLCDTFSPLV